MLDVEKLKGQFHAAYPENGEPAVCRAPGRVNLIGEHTDYNGLPVLPMTIDTGIYVAFAPRKDALVRMRNVDVAFPDVEFTNDAAIASSPTGSWDNYCKAAVQGLNRHLKLARFPGMDMLVSGDIPISAGLSSSSALVVACALAYLRVTGKTLGKDMPRLELAEVLAEAEHYVGTRGGGMDQATIMLGGQDAACKIDFFPLRYEKVPLPTGYAVVVSNSLVKATKTGDALHRYNAGPRLSQLICALVGRQIERKYGAGVTISRLGDLVYGDLCLTIEEVQELFAQTFPAKRTTLDEAARQLDMKPQEVRDKWLGALREPESGFPLQSRARHQLTEYRRVEAARDALLEGNAALLGELMNASHESCARDYEVSCPELDVLTSIARNAGALGSRLTGAGFGGCTVSLVRDKTVDEFCDIVRRKYHVEHLGPRADGYPQPHIFTARASAAAGYV
jgi:N-acetylgalactosamine kinase